MYNVNFVWRFQTFQKYKLFREVKKWSETSTDLSDWLHKTQTRTKHTHTHTHTHRLWKSPRRFSFFTKTKLKHSSPPSVSLSLSLSPHSHPSEDLTPTTHFPWSYLSVRPCGLNRVSVFLMSAGAVRAAGGKLSLIIFWRELHTDTRIDVKAVGRSEPLYVTRSAAAAELQSSSKSVYFCAGIRSDGAETQNRNMMRCVSVRCMLQCLWDRAGENDASMSDMEFIVT